MGAFFFLVYVLNCSSLLFKVAPLNVGAILPSDLVSNLLLPPFFCVVGATSTPMVDYEARNSSSVILKN
jgi:hypothetical protein